MPVLTKLFLVSTQSFKILFIHTFKSLANYFNNVLAFVTFILYVFQKTTDSFLHEPSSSSLRNSLKTINFMNIFSSFYNSEIYLVHKFSLTSS